MNRLGLCLIFSVLAAATALARPEPHRRPAPKRPVIHRPVVRPRPKPPKAHWGVHLGPWGSGVHVSHRVGKHGHVTWTVPVVAAPVVREEKTTIVVQQQPIIVQPVEKKAQEGVELNPAYAKASAEKTRTWVEGYWKVTRDPEGRETERVWVPGYWEE